MNNPGERRALCGICPAGCWVVVTYDSDGKIARVRADDSTSLGVICKLGEYSRDIVYSADRLQYPMKRRGEKGNYEFDRISWDEAYEIIVEKLQRIKKEHGPEAVSMYTGRGSFELAMCDVFQPKGVAVSSASSVLFPFGSPNTMGVGALCYVSFAMIAPHVTMGGMLINMFSDIENADLVVIWGANPATDCPPLDMERIIAAHKRGASVVVIDPRKTAIAKMPGVQWMPVRPGTDGALALGMCNVIIDEELYEEAFVRDWTHGFEDFERYVQHFTPEAVQEITGVPAGKIIELARRLAAADGASSVMYSGLEYSDSGVQAIRATHVLWALAGQMDVPGGRCFSMKESFFPLNKEGHIANPDMTKALGLDRFPVYSSYRGESHAIALPDSVLHGRPYKIRSLINLGGSIITAWPQSDIWRETLSALDFLVCIDRQLTADAAYADIVLPATTMYEIESYMTYGPIFRIREKVVEPVGEARNDFFIMAELAKRLGYGHLYPQDEKELLEHVLRGSGYTAEEVREAGGTVQIPDKLMQYRKWEKGLLRPDGKPGFDTPTGKFEIASTLLHEHGYDALPVYTEPQEGPAASPDLTEQFPLVFNSGARVTTDFRSQHHGIEALYRERPEPTVMINTGDAFKRGIEDGDMVRVRSRRGAVRMRAIVTDDIISGAVDANMGGGGPVGPESWQECNINELTDLGRYDPISGFPVYKALLCEIEKILQDEGAVKIGSGEYDIAAASIIASQSEKSSSRIYLDHNATTPLAPEVREVIHEAMEHSFGNPSSIYREGKNTRLLIESARRSVARMLNCTARRIIFTGCGSEANNMVLKSVAEAHRGVRNRIITCEVEHPSVLGPCAVLEKSGIEIIRLPVNELGLVDPAELESLIDDRTCLVSVMLANNETGTIQPIRELAIVAHRYGALFHTDATQAVGKIPIDVETLGVDFLSLSGHKIYAPKGVGALYLRKGIVIDPLLNGGGQEGGLRAGTENILGIAGLGRAADLAVQRLPEMGKVRAMRDRLENELVNMFEGAGVNGDLINRLPNTINITLPGFRGESLVMAMDQKGVAFSSGSACRSGSPKPSHALMALGLSEEDAHCTVRLSLGYGNTEEEIQMVIEKFGSLIRDPSAAVRFVSCR